MARMGMDVEAVESAGRALKERAGQIDAIVSNLDRSVKGLLNIWDGPDAQTFVHNWWPEHRALLVSARGHVDGLGQSALNNASEQRGVSDAKGDGGGTQPHAGPGTAVPPTTSSAFNAAGEQAAFDKRGGGPFGPGGDFAGQCTSWVNFRRQELIDSGMLPDGSRVPINWKGTNSFFDGAAVSPDPTQYAVGSFDGAHTFIVESVGSGDPQTISVSQMNVGSAPDPKVPWVTTGLGVVSTDTWTLVDKSSNTWHSSISGNHVLTFGK